MFTANQMPKYGGPGRSGFPDLVCMMNNNLVVIELKTDTGRATEMQKQWIQAFQANGIPAAIIHDNDEGWEWLYEHLELHLLTNRTKGEN